MWRFYRVSSNDLDIFENRNVIFYGICHRFMISAHKSYLTIFYWVKLIKADLVSRFVC